MGISRTQLIQKVRNRLGEPMVKVELCDIDIIEHIDYARQKFIKWAIGNATQEVWFTVMLQAGKRFYDLPAGVTDVIAYEDSPIQSGGINTLFTMDNYMFSQGMFGNVFWGGYDLVSYHLVLDFMHTLKKYRTTPYNYKYHKATNQIEINPTPVFDGKYKYVTQINPETGLPQQYIVESPGWILLRTYMIQGATLPNYVPDWRDILKEKKTIIEQRRLTTEEISNKYLILDHTPYEDETDNTDINIKEDIVVSMDGVGMSKYKDWDVHYANPRVITWEGLGLDDILEVGDVVTITYPVVEESNYYPDEWTTVMATSNETEQFVATRQIIDRKFITLRKPIWENNVRFTVGSVDHTMDVDFYVDPRNRRIVRWNGSLIDSVLKQELEEGDMINVEYVTVTSKKPRNASSKPQTINKQYTTKIINTTVTPENVTSKSITMPEIVSVPDGIKASFGGFTKVHGIDFELLYDNVTLSWNGLGLDGLVEVGDNVVISYTSATPIITEVEEDIYESDWILDYVTALSKISLGIVRRKYGNFSSLGNKGISLDGDSLVSEGTSEKEYLEGTLRNEEAFEGYGIEIGLM